MQDADPHAAVRDAARVADGERVLPTTLGGSAVWTRVLDAAALEGGDAVGSDAPEPATVVIVRTDAGSDRHTERTAATLVRSLRGDDVVCLLAPGTYAVLVLGSPELQMDKLADRLVAALLDVGVGAAAGAASDGDPRRAQGMAEMRAGTAWDTRTTLRP